MLAKTNRLSSISSLRGARSISSNFFSIKYVENNEGINKFAFVISKKVDSKAVVRNSIKRKLAKAVSDLNAQASQGYNFLIIAKKEILQLEQKEIEEAIREEYLKINILI